MNNVDWDDIRYFLAAAHSGSLSAASRLLGSNQPTVGRRIASLEQSLGLRLFRRHRQGLALTDDGLRILESAMAMDAAAAGLQRAGPCADAELRGTVRIAAPEGLAVWLLAPALADLARTHPELDLVLQPSTASADLARGEADIAVRLYRPKAGDLVVHRLREMGFGLYASAKYLQRHGVPTSVAALNEHRLIAYGEQLSEHAENRWLVSLVANGRWVFKSDNTATRIATTEAGTGIAVLPHLLAAQFPSLQRILPDQEAPTRTIWLVVHRDLRHVARVRTVMEFLADVINRA